jgi:hypothetical protein
MAKFFFKWFGKFSIGQVGVLMFGKKSFPDSYLGSDAFFGIFPYK